jgi:rhamnogalacturonan acetylesterase
LTIGDGPRFVGYAQDVAAATGVTYVDHYDYVVQAYNAIGETTVDTYYPIDHTHTSPTGANVVAEAFVRGLLCGSSSLKAYVNSAGEDAPSKSMSFFFVLTIYAFAFDPGKWCHELFLMRSYFSTP